MDSSGNAGSSSDVPKTSSQSTENIAGCGCGNTSSITVRVTPTTGGQFDLQVSKTESVENLKKLISKKLKVPKERICLLHRDRQLRDGTLQENQLMDGSRLTLLPSVETGLLAQRPEQSVMQALESLNDSQVNDFLSGKAPLNLTMRLGDHMMLIQLQLSTVTPSVARRSAASSSSSASKTSAAAATSSSSSASNSSHHKTRTTSSSSSSSSAASTSSSAAAPAATAAAFPPPARPCKFFLGKPPPPSSSSPPPPAAPPPPTTPPPPSPLKSLENTVAAATASSSPSCRCDKQQQQATSSQPTQQQQQQQSTSSTSQQQQQTAATAKPTLDTRALAEASRNLTQTLKQLSSEVLTSRSDPVEDMARARRQGAIIESMHHHGRGVYSGTFSGTLNPALQDRFGRPKRDISTIIHILNDLLCATPQYRRHARQGHTITVEASAPKPTAASTSTATAASTSATHVPASSGADKMHTGDNADETEKLSPENAATRGKMEHLRLIMEERRARRRARREARSAPYTTQWSAKSESLPQSPGVEPMETDQPAGASSAEPQLCEVGPPEPVVA